MSFKNTFVIILISIFISACAAKKKPIPSEITPGTIRVMVIDYRDLDGCEFLLNMEDGSKLQPTNLPDEFKKNGIYLDISFKYVNAMSICMAGRMIDLNIVQEVMEPK